MPAASAIGSVFSAFPYLDASFVIDRQSIETTVQQVADGEISLQQATDRLLASDGALDRTAADPTKTPEPIQRETEFESLTYLVQRLGDPPIDIVDCWCHQLRESLQSSPRAIESLNLGDFEVTTDGQIRFAEAASPNAEHANLFSDQIDPFLNAFRQQLTTAEAIVDRSLRDQEAGNEIGIESRIDSATLGSTDSPAETFVHKSAWPKVAMVVGIALCGGALFWIVRANSTNSIAESDTGKNVPSSVAPGVAPRVASGNVFAEFPSTRSRTAFVGNELFDAVDKSLAGPHPSSDSLETLQSLEATSEEEISLLEADGAPNFSLEDLIPSLSNPVANVAENSGEDAAMQSESNGDPSDDQAADSLGGDGSSNTPSMQTTGETDSNEKVLSDDSLESEQPDELQQPTRSAVSAAIKLPPMEQTDPVTIDDQFPSESLANSLTLAFPHEVDLSMRPMGDGGGWTIVADKGSSVVANVDATENKLAFAWSEGASKKTGSRSLHHGCITSSDGSAFFLRPEVEAKPWLIRLDQPDMRPTWDLGSPLPPSATRLSVEFDLPEELEMTWVDPIPTDSPRRARGLAIIKPLDGESVDLAVKFDVRCSRKLSCRLRYAARLDSSMPWQLVSRDLLEQFANQLAGRAELVSREADRLQNVYDMAGTRGKRIIRVKQKYNDGLADSLRQFADRVAELESLIATVESNAALRFRVWVQWPSGDEQTVFASVADDDS